MPPKRNQPQTVEEIVRDSSSHSASEELPASVPIVRRRLLLVDTEAAAPIQDPSQALTASIEGDIDTSRAGAATSFGAAGSDTTTGTQTRGRAPAKFPTTWGTGNQLQVGLLEGGAQLQGMFEALPENQRTNAVKDEIFSRALESDIRGGVICMDKGPSNTSLRDDASSYVHQASYRAGFQDGQQALLHELENNQSRIDQLEKLMEEVISKIPSGIPPQYIAPRRPPDSASSRVDSNNVIIGPTDVPPSPPPPARADAAPFPSSPN